MKRLTGRISDLHPAQKKTPYPRSLWNETGKEEKMEVTGNSNPENDKQTGTTTTKPREAIKILEQTP